MKNQETKVKILLGTVVLKIMEQHAENNANTLCRGLLYEVEVPKRLRQRKGENMHKFKTRMGAFVLAGILMVGSAVPVCAANVAGGIWDYGTKVSGVNEKTVYSNYYHGSKTHKSSVSIGTLQTSSGWVSAGKTSYASLKGKWNQETHAYYSCK